MEVTRAMLKNEYSWESTESDSDIFNRDQGYEVIKVIQAVVDRLELHSRKDIHSIEDLIRVLPTDYRDQNMAIGWLTVKYGIAKLSHYSS